MVAEEEHWCECGKSDLGLVVVVVSVGVISDVCVGPGLGDSSVRGWMPPLSFPLRTLNLNLNFMFILIALTCWRNVCLRAPCTSSSSSSAGMCVVPVA